MVEDVAQLGTTQYGDEGRPFTPHNSVFSDLVLSTAATIESGRQTALIHFRMSETNEVYILLRYIYENKTKASCKQQTRK